MAIVRDAVCGKEIDTDLIDTPVGQTQFGAPITDPSEGTKRLHEGKWYYFCSVACRLRFIGNPKRLP